MSRPGTDRRIRDFWEFWHEVRDDVARDTRNGRSGDWVERVGEQVRWMASGLSWELGPGRSAEFALCVSSSGNLPRRLLTEVWWMDGPADDDVWEYWPTKPGSAGELPTTINMYGSEFDLTRLRVTLDRDEARRRADITLYHSGFAQLTEKQETGLAFTLLDLAFGEDNVTRWFGAIKARYQAGADALTVRDAYHALVPWNAPPEKQFVLHRTNDDGLPVVILADIQLRAHDHLLLSTEARVNVSLADVSSNGLPTTAALQAAQSLDDELEGVIADDGVWVCTETSNGRRTVVYRVPPDPAVHARVSEWSTRYPEVDCAIVDDLEWKVLKQW